jgi:hypothetical protein
MDSLSLSKTELDFLQRLLLEIQRDLARTKAPGKNDEQHVAGIELALAMLRWDGSVPPNLDTQLGLGAAVEMKLGLDAMCAYRHWRNERRRAQELQALRDACSS